MKRIIPIIFSLFLLTSFRSAISIDEVVNAMRTGNVTAMAVYFDNTVKARLRWY
jgi:hypothetical protein